VSFAEFFFFALGREKAPFGGVFEGQSGIRRRHPEVGAFPSFPDVFFLGEWASSIVGLKLAGGSSLVAR